MRTPLFSAAWSIDTSKGRIVQFTLLGIIVVLGLVMLGDRLTSSPVVAVSVAVMLCAAVLMVIDFRLALLLFVGFLFGYEEFNLASEEAFVTDNIGGTVMEIRLFGLALMDFVSVVLLIPVLIREWRHAVATGHWRWMKGDVFLLPVLIVWLYGIVPGLFNMRAGSDFTWDLRILLHVLVFYYIFSRTFTTRRDYLHAILVAAAIFLAKSGVFIWRYLTGGGVQSGVYNRVLLGSDLPLTALALLLTAVALLLLRKWQRGDFPDSAADHALPSNATWLQPALLMLLLYFVVLLIAGLGKLTYLQTLYCFVMIFILHRHDIRPRIVLSIIALSVVVSVGVFYTVLSPEAQDVMLYAVGTAFNWWDALMLYGDLSIGTRYFEIINVWAVLQREGALLWGLGWGAPWREIAVHMPFDAGAFSVEEQRAGEYVQTHVDAVTFMLKVGILGMIVIYASILRFWTAALRLYVRQRSAWEKWVLMALILMILIFAPNYLYFIRLKYLLGFALAGVAVFLATDEQRTQTHTGIAAADHAE